MYKFTGKSCNLFSCSFDSKIKPFKSEIGSGADLISNWITEVWHVKTLHESVQNLPGF